MATKLKTEQNTLARWDAPPVGAKLRDKNGDGTFTATVSEVFPAGQYPGMILDWFAYNPSMDAVGRRGQAFTCRDWRERWEVL